MLKLFVATLFLFQPYVYADAPPVSVKAQLGTKQLPKWNIQVPNNQATATTTGLETLIETGNDNQLINPGFEHATTMTGWSLGTGVTQSSVQGAAARFPGGGLKTPILSLASVTSGTAVLQQTVSQAASGLMAGNIYLASIYAQQTTGFYQLCGVVDSTEQTCVNLPRAVGTSDYQRASVIIIPTTANQTISLRIKATAAVSSDVIAIDNAYLGLAPAGMIGTSTPDTVWNDAGPVPLYGGASVLVKGTTTNDHFYWYRSGPTLFARVEYKQTAQGSAVAGTGVYRVVIPAAVGCSIDTTKAAINAGTTDASDGRSSVGSGNVTIPTAQTAAAQVQVYDSSSVIFSATTQASASIFYVGGTTGTSSGEWYSLARAAVNYNLNFSVPCSGWTPQTAIQTQNSNYPRTPYTPTITGAGTVTGVNCFHSRDDQYLNVDCKFTTGTGTAVNLTVGLPGTLAADSGISGYHQFGTVTQSSTAGALLNALVQGGDTAISMAYNSASGFGPQAPITGSNFASGTTLIVWARIPIQGWTANQNAPQLPQSVVNAGNTVSGVAYATLSSACAVSAASSISLTSGTATTSGCTVALSGYSSPPVCQVTQIAGTSGQNCQLSSATTATAAVVTCPTATAVSLSCIGNK